jgi:hypothetical protein
LPSVPFSPTAPPIPATGFTMNPMVLVGRVVSVAFKVNSLA